MKKSRGFTLVELLAVIVILAVILVIAIPNVMKVIDKAKLDAYKRNESMLISAGRNYVASYAENIPVSIGSTTKVNISDLQTKDLLKDIKDPKSNTSCSGYVLITKISNSEYNYSPYIDCGTSYITQLPITNGLVGYWKLNGNALDNTTNNNNGNVSGATITTDRFGNANSAYSFSGTNYIEVPYSSILKLTSQVTCSTWAYRPDWSIPSGNTRFISKTETGGYTLLLDEAGSGYYTFYVYKNGVGYLQPKTLYTGLSAGWHYFSATFDGRYAKVYIDGVLMNTIDSGSYDIITYSYNNSLIIGAEASASNVPAGQYFNGKIDDIKIYSRALSADEIKYNYDIENNISQ
jgi:prepilin-type N-terminal cleavage/methylation domain-containing protein